MLRKVTFNEVCDIQKKHAICIAEISLFDDAASASNVTCYIGKPLDVAAIAMSEYKTQAAEKKGGSCRANYACMALWVTGRKDFHKEGDLFFESLPKSAFELRKNAKFVLCSQY